jgi:GGDEF domain-containing protein
MLKEVVSAMREALKVRGELFRLAGNEFCVLCDCEDIIELGMIKELMIHQINEDAEISVSAEIRIIPDRNKRIPDLVFNYDA